MARKRNPETGEPYEVPSRPVWRSDAGGRPADARRRDGGKEEEAPTDPSPDAKRAGRAGRASPPLADETVPIESPRRRGRETPPLAAETVPVETARRGRRRAPAKEEQKTVPYRPDRDAAAAGPEGAAPGPKAAGAEDLMSDAIVGWLVVVGGPGSGQVCRLGYGANTLGRGEGARVRIDFGDEQISREAHATVTYDPKGRQFYLQHGGGVNLTYVGDEPVLAPTPLEALQHIVLGRTTLRFVAFCGPDFDWQDLD